MTTLPEREMSASACTRSVPGYPSIRQLDSSSVLFYTVKTHRNDGFSASLAAEVGFTQAVWGSLHGLSLMG